MLLPCVILPSTCSVQTLRGFSAPDRPDLWDLNCLLNSHGRLLLPNHGHVNNLAQELQLWKVSVFDHLSDLLLDDRLHSLHCLLDDFGLPLQLCRQRTERACS